MEFTLQYPIGKYLAQPYAENQKQAWLNDIWFLPKAVEMAIENLDEQQLQTPYRPGGWTVHQVVHHLADSHANAYIRMKLGLTENLPTIKPHDENKWIELADVQKLPVNVSVTLLHALHQRWFCAIENLTDEQWERKIIHPEHNREMTLWYLLGMYAWHGKHHVAHIEALKTRNNW